MLADALTGLKEDIVTEFNDTLTEKLKPIETSLNELKQAKATRSETIIKTQVARVETKLGEVLNTVTKAAEQQLSSLNLQSPAGVRAHVYILLINLVRDPGKKANGRPRKH